MWHFDMCIQCRVIKSSIINVSIIFLDICWVIHWSLLSIILTVIT